MSTTRTRSATRPRPSRRNAARWGRDRLVFAAAVIVALPVLVWAGFRMAGGGDSTPALPAGDPGVAHVHGLGINPADGSLYIATHYGTFRLDKDKKVERVGASHQDTMGFTVAGADRFLGSGHPDLDGIRQGKPPRLGLIESTDAGATWRSLSLSGEADFHGLAFAHGRVYGWDSGSGRFMVSSDWRSWDTRSTQVLAGFAVDPINPDHIVGAGQQGLLDSADGGRTWRPLPGPLLSVLSWDAAAGLVGAGPDGTIHRSADAGASWAPGGRLPGDPQALLSTAQAWYAAAHDEDGTTGIYRSTNAGRTWDLYYRDRQ
jgi:photosystem II stability/assembly factor-like uncharacterized protein